MVKLDDIHTIATRIKRSSVPTLRRLTNLIHCRARKASTDRIRVAHVTIVMMLLLSSVGAEMSLERSDVEDTLRGIIMLVVGEEVRPPTNPATTLGRKIRGGREEWGEETKGGRTRGNQGVLDGSRGCISGDTTDGESSCDGRRSLLVG